MASTIPINQAASLYTMGLKKKFDELSLIKVNNFFRSFFPDEICKERYPVIEVRRGSEKVAIDVIRGHQGIRTQITKHTQKAFDPFYYKLYYDATQLECYYRAFGSDSFNLNAGAELVNGIAVHNKANQDMIERGIEIHCASILENGTCTSLRDGSIIDYKRQAGSMVTLTAGNLWTDTGVDPSVSLKAGCDWLRQEGKVGGYVINAVFGTEAWAAFRSNDVQSEKLKQFNNRRDILMPAQLESTGAIYQGDIDCDSYILRVWTYNDFYENAEGVSTPYMNPKKVYLIAEKPMFTTLYGATPQETFPGSNTLGLVAAKYVLSDYRDMKSKTHEFYIESAPLPVPVTVDMIYTLQPVA